MIGERVADWLRKEPVQGRSGAAAVAKVVAALSDRVFTPARRLATWMRKRRLSAVKVLNAHLVQIARYPRRSMPMSRRSRW
jgi:hypothetical protein